MIDLHKQRAAELGYHEHALRLEFDAWRGQADSPKKPFAKHQSQIARVTTRLEAFLDTIDVSNVTASFETQETAYSHLLGVYRIWSYFRSKFMMRNDDRLCDVLRCADELAWACYSPAREWAKCAEKIDVERLKEPPLVFFSSDATPFAQARTSPFMPEGLSNRDITDFGDLILSLPVPVIGIPWFQLNHLPAIPVVAHEVGHAVESDFQITEPLKSLISGLNIDPQRRKGWLHWRKEVFADVYACICMGPAFLIALIDYLFGEVQEIEKEEQRSGHWKDYPTRTLRIMLNLETLDRLGLLAHSGKPEELTPFLDELPQTWDSIYPQRRMRPFEADIPTVVQALLDAQFNAFGNVALRDVVQYGREQLVKSWYLSDDILANTSFPCHISDPFRVLAAAPALAYARDAQGYHKANSQAGVVKALLDAIPKGVRAADSDTDVELVARKQALDQEEGRKLRAFFRKK